jgi:hypothetical protein
VASRAFNQKCEAGPEPWQISKKVSSCRLDWPGDADDASFSSCFMLQGGDQDTVALFASLGGGWWNDTQKPGG